MLSAISYTLFLSCAYACSDFYMNFSDSKLRFSGRTSDVTVWKNWTISTWPVDPENASKDPFIHWPAKYGTVGMGVKWFGDDKWGFPNVFTDSLNDQGLSCSILALVGTEYELRDDSK